MPATVQISLEYNGHSFFPTSGWKTNVKCKEESFMLFELSTAFNLRGVEAAFILQLSQHT